MALVPAATAQQTNIYIYCFCRTTRMFINTSSAKYDNTKLNFNSINYSYKTRSVLIILTNAGRLLKPLKIYSFKVIHNHYDK